MKKFLSLALLTLASCTSHEDAEATVRDLGYQRAETIGVNSIFHLCGENHIEYIVRAVNHGGNVVTLRVCCTTMGTSCTAGPN